MLPASMLAPPSVRGVVCGVIPLPPAANVVLSVRSVMGRTARKTTGPSPLAARATLPQHPLSPPLKLVYRVLTSFHVSTVRREPIPLTPHSVPFGTIISTRAGSPTIIIESIQASIWRALFHYLLGKPVAVVRGRWDGRPLGVLCSGEAKSSEPMAWPFLLLWCAEVR